MAGLLALLRGLRKSETECRILLLGLDNAGKTSCLKKLADEKKDANAIRFVSAFPILACRFTRSINICRTFA